MAETTQGSDGGAVEYLQALCRTVPLYVTAAVGASPPPDVLLDEAFDGTVMHVDLVGFTTLCERLAHATEDGLSRLSAALDQLFGTLLEDAILPFRGHVIQFGGDSISVCFRGVAHARLAGAAGLSVQQLVRGATGRVLGSEEHRLQLRVGLASGRIDLLLAGDAHRRGIVLAGAAARRAVELQEAAPPGEVLADVTIVDELGDDAEVAELAGPRGALLLRGLRDWPPTDARSPEQLIRADIATHQKIALLEPLVPPHLAARLKTQPSRWRLAPELREAVIVFTELRRVEPAEGDRELAKSMGRCLVDSHRRHGGLIAKANITTEGYRVMTLFGLIEPSEQDLDAALLAALEANARVRALTATAPSGECLRTGVHRGEVYFGAIGCHHRHDITVVGDAVNVAARVASAAQDHEVLATEDIVAQSGAHFWCTEHGLIRLKGRQAPLMLHRVHAAKEAAARYLRPAAARSFFVGREQEVEVLEAAVRAAFQGRGAAIGICGDAGTGKSVMLTALADRWIDRGGIALRTECQYATRGQPLAPMAAMFEAYFGLSPEQDEESVRCAIRVGLQRLGMGDEAEPMGVLLEQLLSAVRSSERPLARAPAAVRDRILTAMVAFIARRAKDNAMLYLGDDLHHADALTLEFLLRLIEITPHHRLLLVGTYQPESILEPLRNATTQELALGPLDRAAAEAIVCHELRADELHPALSDFVMQRSRRNAGSLVELARFLVDSELIGHRGRMAHSLEPNAERLVALVPSSVAHVTLRRLDHLSAVARLVLRDASVVGDQFARELLRRVSAAMLSPDEFARAMAELDGQELIGVDGAGTDTLAFRDPTTRSVAYSTIPERERRQIHRRVADALEQPWREQPSSHGSGPAAATLAYHRDRAGQRRRAIQSYEQAIRESAEASAHPEVCALTDRWQQLVSEADDQSTQSDRSAAELHLLQLIATARLGKARATIELGEGLEQRFGELYGVRARTLIDFWVGEALVQLGRAAAAKMRLGRVLETAADPLLRSDAARLIARVHELAYEREQAGRMLDAATRLAERDVYRLARIDLARANLLADAGDLAGARQIYAAVHEQADAAGWRDLVTIATFNLAYCNMLVGELDTAVRGFEQGIRARRATGDTRSDGQDFVALGQCLVFAGRYREATPHLEKGRSVATELGDEQTLAEAEVHLGLIIGLTRTVAEGVRLCNRGRHRAAEMGHREAELIADLHLLQLAVAGADAPRARAALDRCVGHGAELTHFPLFARILDKLRDDARAAGLALD